ncbi:MAG: GNAT family N-acetyltransferase [Acidobacteria bacterium]|nr:GNAT family N-acetyltransferase [Acidobacteriota bacterium]
MGAEINTETLPESRYDEWTRLLSESPDASVYSVPRYLEVLCQALGGRFSVQVARRGGELAAGVALYECDSRWGTMVAHRPLLYYNGVVARRYETRYPSEQTARQLRALSALAEALGARGYARLTLHSRSSFSDARAFLAAGWTASVHYTYVVPILDLEQAWRRVEQNLRRLVKRCEREGMSAVEDDDFESFYRLHSGTMDRKERHRYLSEAAFRRYVETLRADGLARLYHARLPNGRAVATQLVLLGPGPASHTAAAAADDEGLRSGASAFLRWRVFEALSALGYEANDLTDAALNPVTRFKSQLGGELHQNLVLDAPRSPLYRAGHGAATLARRLVGRLR